MIDIKKYQKNKDLELSNDDLDIEKLTKDIRKGYVLSEEVETAKNSAIKESASKYTELETKFNNLEKSYNDLQAKNVETTNNNNSLKLQVEIMKQKFPEDKLEQVTKLRTSAYSDIENDNEALQKIKEDYGATFFPKNEQTQNQEVPNESNFNNANPTKETIKITRKTSIRDLIKK